MWPLEELLIEANYIVGKFFEDGISIGTFTTQDSYDLLEKNMVNCPHRLLWLNYLRFLIRWVHAIFSIRLIGKLRDLPDIFHNF
jgi:hypothetical protein